MKIKFQDLALLGVISLLLSCNFNSTNELELTCESVRQIMEKDQSLRKTELKPPFFNNLDSLIKASGYEKGLNAMSDLDGLLLDSLRTKAKELIKSHTIFQQRKIDSLWQIQQIIDSLNTIKIISIIETYGLDSLNKIDVQCGQNSLIIFVHSPEGLMEKVREIVTNNKNDVGENRFRHISWHLDGRKE